MDPIYFELVLALAIVLASVVVSKIAYTLLKIYVSKLTRLTETTLDDDLLKATQRPIYIIIVLLGIYLALRSISVLAPYFSQIYDLFSILGILLIAYTAVRLINVFLVHYTKSISLKSKVPLDEKFLPIFKNIAIIAVYGITFIIILDRLGYEITPLIASLGIGGLAIGLALQDTLTNFFAGFHIFVDKPIEAGDFIELEGDIKGYVKEIGWRSTKIRTLPNNIVIVPNSKLAQNVITNYHLPEKEMSIVIPVSVSYDSDLEKVEKVTIDIAKEVLMNTQGGVKEFQPFIRYNEFGDSGIKFSVILRVQEFVDRYLVTHEFIKALMKKYKEENIEIPYPMRTIYIRPEVK